MRASRVLQKCLPDTLQRMRVQRARTLLNAVQAVLEGRRLTLTDVARSWPGAERIRPPLKAFDRLLSNPRLREEREPLCREMARWLLRGRHPVIIIDWAELKADKSWCLLRAAVPVGGRTLTVLDMVFPGKQQGTPAAERRFLQRLHALVPAQVCPILVTDAGFRTPWFRAVSALGWYWVGRLRGWTRVKPLAEDDTSGQWIDCRDLHALASRTPRELPLLQANRSDPIACRLIVHAKPAQGRKHRTRLGAVARNSYSRKAAAREREPWLLVCSPRLSTPTPKQLVGLYGRRMQIELSFRDLKSHRYGQGFEDSLTRHGARLQILLLIGTLASFASWLAGLGCEATGIAQWLLPVKTTRKLYSTLRVGREALVRRWPMEPVSQWMDRLRSPPPAALAHMTLHA